MATRWHSGASGRWPDRRTPLGINTATGAVLVTGILFLTAAAPVNPVARLACLAALLAGFGAATADLPATVVTALLAAVLYDGFVEDTLGVLAWHGGDGARLAVLLVTGALGALAAVGRQARREHHRFVTLERWANGRRGLTPALPRAVQLTRRRPEW